MLKELTDRNLVTERSCCAVRPGLHFGSAISTDEPRKSEDTRLATGASLLLIMLSSLGLWALIWAIVTALA
jgi:hypothetical protein